MDFLQLAKKHEQDMIHDLMELIKIESTLDETTISENAPFGEKVRKALDWMLAKGQLDGFEITDYDGYAGVLSFGDQPQSIGILGHLDVVPAQGDWFQAPFNPFIKEGYLVGRGSSDDKGPTIAAYYALKILKDLGYKFKHRLDLIVGCDEETGMRCMTYFKEHANQLPVKGIVPDADFPVIYAEKGILQFDIVLNNTTEIASMKGGTRSNIVMDRASATLNKQIDSNLFKQFLLSSGLSGYQVDDVYTVQGKAFHASLPQYGHNAGIGLLSFLAAALEDETLLSIVNGLRNHFGQGIKIQNESQSMGALTINLGVISIDEHEIRLSMDVRYPKESHSQFILSQFKKAFVGARLENISDSQPLYNNPNDELVRACMNAYQKITHDMESVAATMGGGTYARTLDNHVAFGADFPNETKPEWVGGPHEINEAISIDALVKACAIYCEALIDLAQEVI